MAALRVYYLQVLAKPQHTERVQIPAELRRNRKRWETVGNVRKRRETAGNGGISKRERKFREIPEKNIEILAKNDKFD